VVQVVHTLSGGRFDELVRGVTSLADEVYVLRENHGDLNDDDDDDDQVEVYDVINYRLQRRLTVPDIRWFADMTSCEHYRCVYIASSLRIHRLDVQGAVTEWSVHAAPTSLSVNAAHNVLVTCHLVRKIKECSSHGHLLRELTLPDDVTYPWHAIQTRSGEFIVCHGLRFEQCRVCKISADGRDVIKSHGGQPGSDIGQYLEPVHLAVDNNEFVFVVDAGNRRVTLLSPTLDYIRVIYIRVCQVVNFVDGRWWLDKLCLDIQRRRLYVTDNEFNEEDWTTGRVVVLSV